MTKTVLFQAVGVFSSPSQLGHWIVSILPLISIFCTPFSSLRETITSEPTTIGINLTLIFHSFFSSLARSKYLPIFSLSFMFSIDRDIGPVARVFANGPGDLGSIPGRVIPKTLKMELDTTLLNTQHYKVRFKGKVEQSREWSSALPYTLV